MNTRRACCKFVAVATATLLLAGWNAGPARASHLDFTLHNESKRSIYFVYVTPAIATGWGKDVLGREVLRRGESTRITFHGQGSGSPCLWDIKVIYANGKSTRNRFNLCAVRSVHAR